MDREQLRAWLAEGLSLAEIAARVERDPTTVGYWVRKHGLSANGSLKHTSRGESTRRFSRSSARRGHRLLRWRRSSTAARRP
jgi:IS30 family transposase